MASHGIDLSAAKWRKSSYSNGTGGDCVEIATGLPGVIPVRDSKTEDGPVLLIGASAWSTFLTKMRTGTIGIYVPPS